MRQTKGKDEMNAITQCFDHILTDHATKGHATLIGAAMREFHEMELELVALTAERDALFNIAVKATQAVDEMGFETLKGKAAELDYALATLPAELCERVDQAALKAAK
jgi:hypothetical protein